MRRLRGSSINIRRMVFGVVVVCVFGSAANGAPWDGNGTPNEPYLIYDANDMQAIGADPNFWDTYFKLMADIDLSAYTGTSFNIIGTDWENPFTGVFDGDGHSISNFVWESNGISRVGMFGSIGNYDSAPEIKNLMVVSAYVDAGDGSAVGTLVGYSYRGIITNCHISGTVTGQNNVGLLVGDSHVATVSECSASGGVVGTSRVGGLVGLNGWSSTVLDCFATANVIGQEDTGGLVGCNNNGVSNCYATGSVEGKTNAGGLVGYNHEVISNCYATGTVTGTGYTGGLVGRNSYIVEQCYSVGYVSDSNNSGGLAGYNSGWFHDCYWDVNSSGITHSEAGIGKTTDQMQSLATFEGWGCPGVWRVDDGNDYPRLLWEGMPGVLIAKSNYGGGSGAIEDPYLICSAKDLHLLGTQYCDWGKHFVLMNDIDLSAYDGREGRPAFNIIGYGACCIYGRPFTGVFDGNGNSISNFIWESNETDNVGIFGYVRRGSSYEPRAEIKRLFVTDPNVDAWDESNIAVLVGFLQDGIISQCHVIGGQVQGGDFVGALLGRGYESYGYRKVSNCSATTTVSGNEYAGGLVGSMVSVKGDASIENSWASGSVSGTTYVGGLAGQTACEVLNCFAAGDVNGLTKVGGLLGQSGDPYSWYTKNCYTGGHVKGTSQVGGLIGYSYLTSYISCFWDKSINPDVNGIGNTTDPNVIGKSITEMQTKSTFTDAGWDFVDETINGPNDIWTICEGTNYPRFVWQIPTADFLCPDGVNFIDYAFFAEHWLQTIYGDCGGVELTGDGKVSGVDFALFAEYWMLTSCGECGGADFTGDENVDLADLSAFVAHWLETEYAEVDLTNDGQVGLDDLREFTNNWLAGL